MIRDQADQLRRLALRDAVRGGAGGGAAVPVVVVAGGKGGVGTTSVAVSLAACLSLSGYRMLLVDADLGGAGATALCGLDVSGGLPDVLARRRNVHESLVAGPAGMQVLGGPWPGDSISEIHREAPYHLMQTLRRLDSLSDLIVLDAGNGRNCHTGEFWRQADLVLLISQTDDDSVIGAYSAVKLLLPEGCATPVLTLINRSADLRQADEVHQRLRQACRRFLGRRLMSAGQIAEDTCLLESAAARQPVVLHAPRSPAAVALTDVAKRVAGHLPAHQLPARRSANTQPRAMLARSAPADAA